MMLVPALWWLGAPTGIRGAVVWWDDANHFVNLGPAVRWPGPAHHRPHRYAVGPPAARDRARCRAWPSRGPGRVVPFIRHGTETGHGIPVGPPGASGLSQVQGSLAPEVDGGPELAAGPGQRLCQPAGLAGVGALRVRRRARNGTIRSEDSRPVPFSSVAR